MLLHYTNLFYPDDYKKNDKVIYKFLKTNMVERASLDEPRNYLLDEIKHNDLMSEKNIKTCKYLNYVENLLILYSTVTGCVSVSAFASLLDINIGITSSAVRWNICAIIAGIIKFKSMIKKKKKKHDKIVLLLKDKLNTVEVLISKSNRFMILRLSWLV